MFHVHKKYSARHALLGYLKAKVDKKPGPEKDMNISHTSLHELAKKMDIPFTDLYDYQFALLQNNHIRLTQMGEKFYVNIEEKGYAAFIDEYWLREGHKECNERIYNKTKWIILLLVVIMSAATLIFSIYTIRKMNNRIETLQKILNQQRSTSVI